MCGWTALDNQGSITRPKLINVPNRTVELALEGVTGCAGTVARMARGLLAIASGWSGRAISGLLGRPVWVVRVGRL
jgi:hypothetical protein